MSDLIYPYKITWDFNPEKRLSEQEFYIDLYKAKISICYRNLIRDWKYSINEGLRELLKKYGTNITESDEVLIITEIIHFMKEAEEFFGVKRDPNDHPLKYKWWWWWSEQDNT